MKKNTIKPIAILIVISLLFLNFLPTTSVFATGSSNGGTAPEVPGYTMFKIDSNELKNGEHSDGVLKLNVNFTGEGSEQKVVNWTSNINVYKVYVKAGTGGNWYEYPEGSLGASGLVAPDNKGISHVAFYYNNGTVEPPPVVEFLPLELSEKCTENPEQTRQWKITNKNGSDVTFSYELVGTNQKGEMAVPANSFKEISTQTVNGENTLKVFVADKPEVLLTSKGSDCSPPKEDDVDLKLINLTALCTENPEQNRKWKVTNNSSKDLDLTYLLVGTEQKGNVLVKAKSTIEFETKAVSGENKVKLFVAGVEATVVVSDGAKCEVPAPEKENVITKINLVVAGCEGLIEEANLIVKHKGKIKFGSTAELSKYMLENQDLVFEDIQAIEIKVAGKNKHFKLSDFKKNDIVVVDGVMTINLHCETEVDEEEELLIKKVYLVLKNCEGIMDNIKLVFENGEKLDFVKNETKLELILEGKGLKLKDVVAIELNKKGHHKLFKLKEMKKEAILFVNGELTINIDCFVEGVPQPDEEEPEVSVTVLTKIHLILKGFPVKVAKVKLLLKEKRVIDFKNTDVNGEYLLDEQVNLEDIEGIQIEVGGKVKTYPLTAGAFSVKGTEMVLNLTYEEDEVIAPTPVTDTDGDSDNGNEGGGLVDGTDDSSSETSPWYGKVLPQTGEASPFNHYLGGLVLAGLGLAMLRKRKLSKE